MPCFSFYDMRSGGNMKSGTSQFVLVDFKNENLAKAVFQSVTTRDPDNVTCTCCGCDYWITGPHESISETIGDFTGDTFIIGIIRKDATLTYVTAAEARNM